MPGRCSGACLTITGTPPAAGRVRTTESLFMRTAVDSAMMIPASIPSPDWSGFSIGPLTIHAYALCILAGIAAALWLTSVRWARRGAPEGSVWDIAIWAIPFGIIGGRLYHVFSSPDAYFGPHGNLWLIPQIWLGGLGIWGAVALGAVGAWIGCRQAGVKLTAFVDVAVPGVLLAQAMGRWGNYFNQELFGGPTTLPWGLQIDPTSPNFPAGYPADTLFHPTFLYESLWDLAGVAVLLLLDRKFKLRRSRLFWLYAMTYTLGRVWIEAMRIDNAEHILGLRLNVWTSILVFAVSLAIFLVLTFTRRTALEVDTVYLPGREPKADADDGGPRADTPVGADNDTNNEQNSGESTTAASDRGNLQNTKTAAADSAPSRHEDGKRT